MEFIKSFYVFVFIVLASAAAVHRIKLADPRGNAREACRIKHHFTKEQLITARHDFFEIRNFLVCLGKSSGQINKDDTINRNVFIENLSPVVPMGILTPIVDCCINAAFGKNPKERVGCPMKIAEFAGCFRDLLPASLYNTIGVLAPPVYHPLEECCR